MKAFLKNRFTTLYFFYQYIGSKIYVVFGFSVLMVLMDSFGLALFIPLLQIADKGVDNSDVAEDKLTLIVNDLFSFLNLSVSVPNMLLLIIVIFSLKGLFSYYAMKYNALVQQTVMLKMRTKLAASVRDLSYSEFVKTDVGRLQNSLLAEVWQVISGCTQYMDAIKNGLFVLIYLGFALFMDWRFSILVMIGGLLTNWIYKFFYVKTQKMSREITKNNHRYGAITVEVINHFKYLKTSGRDSSFYQRLQFELENLVRSNIVVAKLSAKLSTLREPMTIVVICAVILFHVSVLKSPLSGVIIILLFFYRIMQKIIDVQNNWNSYLSHTGSIENIISFQQYLDENKDTFYSGNDNVSDIRQLRLENISVTFDKLVVLKNINLTINKNESIAFVGESGSGKTTLVNVISNLLPYSSGNIFLNDKDIRLYNTRSFKEKIGYIGQEATVFNGTIFENITFWEEKTASNLEKFNKVVDMCALRSFLTSLTEGENTLLGNNGINLSGGQRQRVSIARELYRDVELLIMDEATSALDSETENDIKESIEAIQGKVTIISIAHRLSTIKNVDNIYLLDKGSIVEFGAFDVLKEKSNYFKKLTELQGI